MASLTAATTSNQTFFPINDLSAYQSKWTLKARVISKTPVRTFGEGKQVFSAEIADSEGGEIRASFFGDAAAKFKDTLTVGKVYTFSRGSIKVANKQYNNLSHRYELTFDRDAQIAEVSGETGEYKTQYNFSNIQAIQSKTPPCRVDVCGVVTAFRPPATVTTKDGRELVKREVTLVDDTAMTFDITLWDEKAKLPDAKFEGNPVLALKAVLVKEWQGLKAGGTIESSLLAFTPDLPEVKRLQQWWQQGGSGQSFMNVTEIQAVQSKPSPCRVDLIGIVSQFKSVSTVTTKEGKELTKRDVVLADSSGAAIDVTLWGERGQEPDSRFENNPVLLMKNLYVKEFNGGRSASTIEASEVVFEPENKEAVCLREWWAKGGSSQSLTSLRGTGGGGGGSGRSYEYCDVAAMRQKSQQLGSEETAFYKVSARLAVVTTRKQGEQIPIHYKACQEIKEGAYGKLACNKRVDGSGYCASCNLAGKTAHRLNFRGKFSDFGDSVWLTTFNEAAETLVGMTADQLAELDQGEEGRDKLDAKLRQRYYSEPLELTIRAKMDSYQGEQRTNVTCTGAGPIDRRAHGRKLLGEVHELIQQSGRLGA